MPCCMPVFGNIGCPFFPQISFYAHQAQLRFIQGASPFPLWGGARQPNQSSISSEVAFHTQVGNGLRAAPGAERAAEANHPWLQAGAPRRVPHRPGGCCPHPFPLQPNLHSSWLPDRHSFLDMPSVTIFLFASTAHNQTYDDS